EEALFLTKFASKVTIIHRKGEMRASKIMQERVRKNGKISFIWDTEITEILGESGVTGARVKNVKTGAVSDFKCNGIFVAIGHEPNTRFLKGAIQLDEKGYVSVKKHTMTSVDGVFAAGDVVDHRYRQAVTAAADGCRAAIDAEKWLEEKGLV
ncbi:MAG: FAD-dependent oxidoreductase, partial [Candidatus Aenigmarchaeota archaeon]|nr:FAD-dependent oxidoreductase [Candidatus Aenigmarchaeota archaeon]